jgi:glycine dehydrogenase
LRRDARGAAQFPDDGDRSHRLEIANASLLDEATAAAEAMTMSYGIKGQEGRKYSLCRTACHPQTIDVVRTRAAARGITSKSESLRDEIGSDVFGVLLQYPTTDGEW